MSAHSSSMSHAPMSRARGQALIAALLLVTVLAAGALLANGDLRARAEAVAHARSLEALAQARSALIGYAISYEERHPGEGYGFMPCPDSGNDGSTPIGASACSACSRPAPMGVSTAHRADMTRCCGAR